MKKLSLRKKKPVEGAETSHRITNETVAEHRERVLAGGRRFKYPMQYARHRLVINTIVISLVALVAILVLVWQQLYSAQNSSSFFYRITRALPLPVASIDGQTVRYSEYLASFRSQAHYLQTKEGVDLYSKENKSQLDWYKRQAMNDALADGYAEKIAHANNIKVSDNEVTGAIKSQRQSATGEISEDAYYAIALDHYGWDPDEVKEETSRSLLRQKVAYTIDTTAAKQRDAVVEKLKTEKDFDKVAAAIPAEGDAKVEASVTPLVPSNNQDGGLANRASALNVGEVSEVFRSTTGDGYYVVKLLQKDNNGRVSYAALKIPLTTFNKQLQKLKDDHKVNEYISIPEVKSPLTTS
jgi:hypothetical protein